MADDDIIERLRKRGGLVCIKRVPLIPQEDEYEWRADALCAEAANEIVRLRLALIEAQNPGIDIERVRSERGW